MASFKEAYKVVRRNEGGYANNPNDTGGETYKGVSRNNFPAWKGWAIIDQCKNDPAGFEFSMETNGRLQSMVLNFYKTEFWDVLKLDFVQNQNIATELFDTGVNMGHKVAARFLQAALNVTNRNEKDYSDIEEDGIIGTETLRRLNGHKRPGDVLKLLNCLQGVRYVDICRKRPKNEEFMPGWLTRVEL